MSLQDSREPGWVEHDTLKTARCILGIERMVCSIFERSIPEDPDRDLGFGSMYGQQGQRMATFLRSLGFDSILVGPSGQTSLGNSSPYDGSIFARSHLSIDLGAMVDTAAYAGWLDTDALAVGVKGRPAATQPERIAYRHAWLSQAALLHQAFVRFTADRGTSAPNRDFAARLPQFQADSADWLVPAGLYAALCRDYAHEQPECWRGPYSQIDAALPGLGADADARARMAALQTQHAAWLEEHAFVQLIAHEQHAAFQAHLRSIGMRLIGDLQAGLSLGDRWAHQAALLPGYAMGAPPSRTNPEGQPWAYPVLDPRVFWDAHGQPGPGHRLIAARIEKALEEQDSLRIDHPHALVCPWVYRTDLPDPFVAVQQGARLFESPDLPDHPGLAQFAIARRSDLATQPGAQRWSDGWVTHLDDRQVQQYSRAFALLVDIARRLGSSEKDLLCEVLSTLPYPLSRVLSQYGLGRFRVTQKARLDDPGDVYRAENAQPEDYIMVGNHDTPRLLQAARIWRDRDQLADRALYLAKRLAPGGHIEPLAACLRTSVESVVAAEYANLFIGPARNVLVFVFDLFGETEVFNVPGTVDPRNFSLRLPRDFEQTYAARLVDARALNMPLSMALAMRARGVDFARAHADVLARLDVAARCSQTAIQLLDAQQRALLGT